MGMFCYQCQETARNSGCTVKGVCGKEESTANLQDLLLHVLKGIALYGERLKQKGPLDKKYGEFIVKALFATITNANFDDIRFNELIREGLAVKDAMKKYKAVYFAAIGGAGALISKSIKKSEVIAYDELGAEAVRRLEVEDFPVTVINDIYGGDLYEEGKAKYRLASN